jgi:hypothetical protein
MCRKLASALTFVIVFSCAAAAQDAKTVAEKVLKAMGGKDLKTLQFTGSGSQPDQLKDGNTPGPRSLVKSYIYTVDYTIPASKLERAVIPGLPPQQMLGGERMHGM